MGGSLYGGLHNWRKFKYALLPCAAAFNPCYSALSVSFIISYNSFSCLYRALFLSCRAVLARQLSLRRKFLGLFYVAGVGVVPRQFAGMYLFSAADEGAQDQTIGPA